MRALLLLVVAVACASTTRSTWRHDLGRHDEACRHVDSTRTSRDACTFDSDCAICHDGTDCGTVASTDHVEALGSACQKADAAQCELASARCCGGVCVVSGYGPD